MRSTSVLIAALICVSTACGDDDPPVSPDASMTDSGTADAGGPIDIDSPPGCNPLNLANCAFPFPNMTLLAEDPASTTGYRLAATQSTLGFEATNPTNREALATYLNRADGFSTGTPMMAQLGDQPVDRATLPSFEDLAASVAATSSIQILHRETGRRIPLWAETDLRAEDPAQRAVMIHAQEGLENATRYAVVITNSVKAEGGADLVPSDGFRALRDEVETTNDSVEGMRAEYDQLFTFLADNGVVRDDVLLSWEFVTFSDEFATGLMVPHVELGRAAAEDPTMIPCDDCAAPYEFAITECLSSDMADATATGCTFDDTLHATELRRITGTFTAPSFLDPTSSVIGLDATGAPQLADTTDAELIVHVPASLATAPADGAPLVVFGHGLLAEAKDYLHSDRDESGVMALMNDLGAVAVASRWNGLSTGDVPTAVMAIRDGVAFEQFVAGLTQSMVSTNLLPPLARGPLGDDPALSASGGGSLIDDSRVYYYGISLGGIFGTVFMGVSPDVRTGVLHVPTSMFSNVLQHSYLFATFQTILQMLFPAPLEQQVFIGWSQRLFDALDPINYIRHLDDPGALTALGAKNCLWQINWGDAAAPDFNAYSMARTTGIPLVDNSPYQPYGLESLVTPSAPNTSAMMIWDPGLGRRPLDNDNSTPPPFAHGATRRNAEVRQQIVDYFDATMEGRVTAECGGPCVITPEPIEGDGVYPPP